MSGVTQKSIGTSEDGMRLDRWFHLHFPQVSHGQLQKFLRKGQVRVDGGRSKASRRLISGQEVRIPPLPEQTAQDRPRQPKRLTERDVEFIRSLVLHRDKNFIAINKPSGLSVQGGTGQERHVDGLLEGLKFELEERPKLVHRLDRDTSGVLMLARSRQAATLMGQMLKKRDTSKLYWAVAMGTPRPAQGQIELALAKRKGRAGEKMQVCYEDEEEGQFALTKYFVLQSAAQRFSFVALTPVTGRTHQLRVHMNEIGFPIVGDGKYGGADAHPGGEISRKLHLHARSFSFTHPDKGKLLTIRAELPDHMQKSFDLLGFDGLDKDNPFM
ncbi:MAG: RluA family pseudouridine synthase [Hyphomicrobiaceae bacterium]|nr:RluA family pseudouridine synthase [Hyphomicrobiaceae bacterium]